MDTTRLRVDGEKLREARGDRSPTEVAEAVGITYAQLWNIESGKSQPSSPVLLSLCAIYGRDASEFAIEAVQAA